MLNDELYLKINLQLFAAPEDEGRTEEPTEKKIREAREKGKVAKTTELASALVLLIGFFVLAIFASNLFYGFLAFMRSIFDNLDTMDFTFGNFRQIATDGLIQFAKLAGPLLVISMIIAFVADVVQVGFKFTLHPLKPEFSKISFTMEKLRTKIFFSREVLVNFIKSVLKVIIILGIAIFVIYSDYPRIVNTIHLGIMEAVKIVSWSTFKMAIWTSIILLFFSGFDYLYQRWSHMQSLKMTVHEVKEERKQYEGDPLIKMRQRERHRELAMRRMMQEVPKADVVVTNPTHFAVALLYEPEYMNAAQVVAKGADLIAKRIMEIAGENNVPLIQDRVLARTLYKEVDIGEEIPPILFEAVANVLVQIYKMREKKEAVI
ncbi:MAG: flagellar biosynthesis protein FlhB [Spirochaetes bacterium]|nr:flagellar biosynthesis protein FlhB [Spirochaetota bacterium]